MAPSTAVGAISNKLGLGVGEANGKCMYSQSSPSFLLLIPQNPHDTSARPTLHDSPPETSISTSEKSLVATLDHYRRCQGDMN
jgi:hypothetical protein